MLSMTASLESSLRALGGVGRGLSTLARSADVPVVVRDRLLHVARVRNRAVHEQAEMTEAQTARFLRELQDLTDTLDDLVAALPSQQPEATRAAPARQEPPPPAGQGFVPDALIAAGPPARRRAARPRRWSLASLLLLPLPVLGWATQAAPSRRVQLLLAGGLLIVGALRLSTRPAQVLVPLAASVLAASVAAWIASP